MHFIGLSFLVLVRGFIDITMENYKHRVREIGNDKEVEFQEIEIHIFHEIESFCKIVQEIEKALGGVIISGFFSYLA
jgi:hypothetical protein